MALYVHLSYNGTIYTLYVTYNATMIIPILKEVISIVMHENPSKFIQNIPMSNNTVKRRIDEMGPDIELQLVRMIQKNRICSQPSH